MKNTKFFKILPTLLSIILIFSACAPQSADTKNSESTAPGESVSVLNSQTESSDSVLSSSDKTTSGEKHTDENTTDENAQGTTATISDVTEKSSDKNNSVGKPSVTKKSTAANNASEPSSKKTITAKPSADGTIKDNKSDKTQQTTSSNTATTATPTTQKPTQAPKNTCKISIICKTVNDNINSLKPSKKDFVPSDGIILENATVEIKSGDTAFDVLKRACESSTCKAACKYCKKNGIQIEYTYTPGFNTYYVEGIHQLYEKDCGMQSGWMYSVNGTFPNVGASSYTVKSGDTVKFLYTCDMGEDIGNHY